MCLWDWELVHVGEGLTTRITLIGIIKLQRSGPEELRKEMEKEI
mgnify:CR=1 FL=1